VEVFRFLLHPTSFRRNTEAGRAPFFSMGGGTDSE